MPRATYWPSEAYEPYETLISSLEDIHSWTATCLAEGWRLTELFRVLCPLIQERAETISQMAGEIYELKPDNPLGGQPAKLYKVMEKIEPLASDIANLVDEFIKPAIRKGDFAVAEGILKGIDEAPGIKQKATQIQDLLDSLSKPKKPKYPKSTTSALAIWDEVDSVVERADRKVRERKDN